MPVDDYLKYSSKPNAESIDGVLRPKSIPTKAHAVTARRVMEMLSSQGVEALAEMTLRMSPTKFLIPT